MASFTRRCEKYVGYDEMQELLKYARENCSIKFGAPQIPLGWYAYVEDTMSYVRLTMKKDWRACTYIFRKDLVEQTQEINGMTAYIEISKDFKRATGYSIPLYDNIYGSARALLTYRKGTERTRVPAYSYDQNSSYAWAMKQPMPDTRTIAGRNRKVAEGEMGFTCIEDFRMPEGFEVVEGSRMEMTLPEDNRTADIIFKTMPSPFVSFADRWYARKCNPKDDKEKNRAKQMLVYSVGYFQKKNPFLRGAIVEYANRYILSLIDENTIYCNTDSIVSTKPRNDLKLGSGLGEFKLEHPLGMFAHIGFNYQWDLDTPSYRHIPKSWFPPKWDLLKDDIPTNGNIYELNQIELKLEENKYGKDWSLQCSVSALCFDDLLC